MKNKVVLITGGTRGLGKWYAHAFAKEGAMLSLVYKSDENIAVETKKEITEKYGQIVEIYRGNVEDENDVMNIVKQSVDKFGKIDILINNAGIFKDSISWKMDKKAWEDVIATNLTGTFLVTKHVLPIMRNNNWGRIVNISSVVGQIGVVGASNYSASKSGLFGFTKAVAREVANKNITVNCVALGYFEEGMNLRLSEELRAKILEQIPLKRFGKVEEASSLILFLCSEEAGYITGQVIHINGGIFM